MKVVFLDIDGVLNHQEFIYSKSKRNKRYAHKPSNKAEEALAARVPEDELADHFWDFRGIDPKKVKLLEQLYQATGAKVVLSSSWRKGKTGSYMSLYLECCGFTGEVIGSTPADLHLRDEYISLHEQHGHTMRGWEIQEWLKEHPEVTSFVILDDESDMDGVHDRLVKTRFETGLTKKQVDEAIALLST